MKTRTIINILLIAACTNAAYATDFVTFKRHSLSDIELTSKLSPAAQMHLLWWAP